MSCIRSRCSQWTLRSVSVSTHRKPASSSERSNDENWEHLGLSDFLTGGRTTLAVPRLLQFNVKSGGWYEELSPHISNTTTKIHSIKPAFITAPKERSNSAFNHCTAPQEDKRYICDCRAYGSKSAEHLANHELSKEKKNSDVIKLQLVETLEPALHTVDHTCNCTHQCWKIIWAHTGHRVCLNCCKRPDFNRNGWRIRKVPFLKEVGAPRY